jgi:hypothetical protein|tara:strand:- start:246 stop:1190 length:945 start_codon:yes stop_codon:yes gene_type:complete
MAVKNIVVTDTLETFRTTFNDLALNDFGDIATLSGAISATTLVGAMNETISIATSSAGFTIEDSSSTQQIVGGGDVLRVFGTSNEIEAVVSATDLLTIGLPNAVSITTSVTAPTVSTGNMSLTNGSITDSSGQISFVNENLVTTGTINGGAITGTSITGSGATHTLGTIEISGNTIRSTDSSMMIINDNLTINNKLVAGVTSINPTGTNNIESSTGFTVFGSSLVLAQNKFIAFEGASDNTSETTLTVIDPSADNVLSLPDNTGTIISTGSTDAITETMMANDAIGQNELKSVVSLIIYNSSGTALKTIFGAGA